MLRHGPVATLKVDSPQDIKRHGRRGGYRGRVSGNFCVSVFFFNRSSAKQVHTASRFTDAVVGNKKGCACPRRLTGCESVQVRNCRDERTQVLVHLFRLVLSLIFLSFSGVTRQCYQQEKKTFKLVLLDRSKK